MATKYKKISLYNPETRKSRTVCVKVSDFDSPEELEAYCKRLRDQNRLKNAEYRRAKAREGIVNVIARIESEAADGVDNAETHPHEMPIGDITIPKAKKTVSIDLDRKTGSTIVIYGSSKRGKSTLMMHLYERYFKSKDRINTLFSGNPHLKVYKGDPKLLVGYGFGPDHAKYIQMQHYINVKTSNEYKFTNMFDDIVDQKYSAIVNKMVLTYRNANISMIMALQYVYLLSKQNRANINHTFVFGMNSTEDIKGVIDVVLRPYFVEMGLLTLDQMVRFFKLVTSDHGFMYINNIKATISFHRLEV